MRPTWVPSPAGAVCAWEHDGDEVPAEMQVQGGTTALCLSHWEWSQGN